MAAKRFMYVSIGLLALTVAFEWGASTARGQASGFRVIGSGTVVAGDAVYFLDTANAPEGWRQLPYASITLPPVPASSLVNYSSGFLAITDSGEGWGKVGGVWTNLGPVPTTPTLQSTWGGVKAKYRK
jgi:hypothetical protein